MYKNAINTLMLGYQSLKPFSDCSCAADHQHLRRTQRLLCDLVEKFRRTVFDFDVISGPRRQAAD